MHHTSTIETAVSTNPVLSSVLERWASIDLPDCWLVAGAVAQAVWNRRFAFAPDHGIRDVDIVYFDPDDLSARGEAVHDLRLNDLFADLPVQIDAKNEARVHLWYEAKFGYPIAPYRCTSAAIATFPTTATTIGVRPSGEALEMEAPFGLSDLCAGVVRPNKTQITQKIYDAKVDRWRVLWPELDIRGW